MFSEKQIKRMIAESSNEVVEALQDQDVVAKTLKQTQANYSVDLHEAFSNGNYSDYFKSDTAYMRFEEINGVLWFIISGQFVAQAFTGTNATFNFIIPNEFKSKYYDKIYRGDGTKLNEEALLSADILVNSMAVQISGGINVRAFKLVSTSNSANSDIALVIISYGNTTEDANVKMDIRIPITTL